MAAFRHHTLSVAREVIDPYVVYRRIKPLHNTFTNMGTYQRRLDRYEESPILVSPPGSGRCVNCHAFANYQPDRMLLHSAAGRAPACCWSMTGP